MTEKYILLTYELNNCNQKSICHRLQCTCIYKTSNMAMCWCALCSEIQMHEPHDGSDIARYYGYFTIISTTVTYIPSNSCSYGAM